MSAISLPIQPGWISIAAGDDFEFFTVVRPGDILTCREKVAEAYEKQGRSGHIIFVIREKTFTNQNGQIVMVRRLSGVSLKPLSEDAIVTERHLDLDVGDNSELPVLVIGPVTIRYLAMFAVATAEFVDIHYDRDYAKSVGLPNVIIQGLYKTTIITQMLKNWAGDGTLIRRITVQHRSMDIAGNTLTAGGRIVGSSQEQGDKLTKCEVWVENQKGQRCVTGNAAIPLLEKM